MKSVKPNNVFAPYEKQGQRSAIFHGFFFNWKRGNKGHRGHNWTQGTQMDTGDTRDTRDTRGHKGHRGDRGTQGDRTKGTNIVFDLSFT